MKASKKFCSTKCWQLDYYEKKGDKIRARNLQYAHKWGVKKPKELWVYKRKTEEEKSENRRRWEKEKYANDPNYRSRQLARIRANNALIAGKITKQPCKTCGSENSEMHHADYSKPFDVTWLCRKHHLETHMAITPP